MKESPFRFSPVPWLAKKQCLSGKLRLKVEHLVREGQLFLIVTQGGGKLRPFVKTADEIVVRAGKKKLEPHSI